jgi:predicted neutral ceramidase superfamily lipid hydrolase
MISLLQSRKFWAALIAFIALVINESTGKVIPTEEMTGLVLIVIGYLVAISLDPSYEANKLQDTLKDRKFWAAVVGIVVIILAAFNKALPISSDNVIEIASLVGGYIVSIGWANQSRLSLKK